jgi:hypothetical protein
MQFFKSTILLAVAFVTFAAAAPSSETLEARGKKECKPLLESCAVDSECCGDLCLAGVSISTCCAQLGVLMEFVISQLCI